MPATPSRRGRYVIIALVLVVIGALWRTAAIEGEKRRIVSAYDEAQQAVNELQTERDRLSHELEAAKSSMSDQTADITRLHNELAFIESKLDETVVDLASLQRDHEALRLTNSSLASQLASVSDEKQALEARLGDIKELRLAIREVKQRMSSERWAQWRAKVQAFKEEDQRRLAAGNRGYLIKNGTSMVNQATRMHVKVLEPETAQE